MPSGYGRCVDTYVCERDGLYCCVTNAKSEIMGPLGMVVFVCVHILMSLSHDLCFLFLFFLFLLNRKIVNVFLFVCHSLLCLLFSPSVSHNIFLYRTTIIWIYVL